MQEASSSGLRRSMLQVRSEDSLLYRIVLFIIGEMAGRPLALNLDRQMSANGLTGERFDSEENRQLVANGLQNP